MLTHRLWTRALLLLRMRTSAALDATEDPREVMDYAYDEQLARARRVRQGLVEVATARRQLERQVERLRARAEQLQSQAREAIGLGREDLARRALERKHALVAEREHLERQLAEIAEDEQRLRAAEQQIAARVEAFRTRRSVVVARYLAAEAQVRAGETLAGIADEATELSLAVARAEDRVDRLQARAAAFEAIDFETLDSAGAGEESIERDLHAIQTARAIDEELARLRRAAQAPPPPPAAEPPSGPVAPAEQPQAPAAELPPDAHENPENAEKEEPYNG